MNTGLYRDIKKRTDAKNAKRKDNCDKSNKKIVK